MVSVVKVTEEAGTWHGCWGRGGDRDRDIGCGDITRSEASLAKVWGSVPEERRAVQVCWGVGDSKNLEQEGGWWGSG